MALYQSTITNEQTAELPSARFDGHIIVIEREDQIENMCRDLSAQSIIGFDTETRPSFKRGRSHKVALLQIATTDTCFLFRLNQIGMPAFLQDFLMGDTLKIGLSLKDDFMMLRRRKDVHAEEGNWIELQDYVGRF